MTALVHRRNRHPHRGRKRRAAFGSRGGGRTAAGGLWDDHGLALYLLGYALTGSSEDARFLVAEAITDYDSGPDRTGRRCTGGVRAELARLVYLGSERGGGASGQAVMLREHADGTVAESLPMQEVMI